MNAVSQAFAPQAAPDPSLTFSYFIANATNVILILLLSLGMATILSTIAVLLLLKFCQYISDALLETLDDDIEDGRIRTLVVRSSLAYQAAMSQISGNREGLHTYIQQASEMRLFHKRPSQKLPPLVIYGQDELRTFCSDCVICLENFTAGESCQVLPLCNHLFHSYCIELWLKDNASCPVCRNCLLDT